VLLEQSERAIDERRPRGVVPGGAIQAVRSVLGKNRHDVLSVWRERWVIRRRDGDLEQRRPRWRAVLGVVPGAIQRLPAGTDVGGATVLRSQAGGRQRRVVR